MSKCYVSKKKQLLSVHSTYCEIQAKMASRDYSFEVDGVNYTQVANPSDIQAGDHVCYYKFPYYHHAIVAEVSDQTLTLIGWMLGIISKEIQKYPLEMKIGSGYFIYKAVYTKGCYENEEVLSRANSRVGEKDYGIIYNFARGFPRWCKTGRGSLTYDDRTYEDRYKRYKEAITEGANKE